MLRSEFDIPADLLYFNAAHQVSVPRRVLAATIHELTQYEINPSQAFLETPPRIRRLEQRLADFFSVSVEDIFLRSNITGVLNTFIQGFDLQGRREIVISDFEYSSVQNAARVRAERDGLVLRRLVLPSSPAALQSLTSDQLLERLASQLTPQTAMVVLSHITGGIGLRIPVAALSRYTREKGILLVVDGAHASGTEEIERGTFREVDAYAISLQKAMFGPKGTALGWVHPLAQNRLRPWEGSLATFESGGGWRDRFRLAGSFDYAPFLALDQTLALWDQYGPQNIWKETRRLRQALASRLSSLALQPCWSEQTELQSAILTCRLSETWKTKVDSLPEQALKQERLQLSAFRIQDTPHLQLSALAYNTDGEISQVQESLTRLLA